MLIGVTHCTGALFLSAFAFDVGPSEICCRVAEMESNTARDAGEGPAAAKPAPAPAAAAAAVAGVAAGPVVGVLILGVACGVGGIKGFDDEEESGSVGGIDIGADEVGCIDGGDVTLRSFSLSLSPEPEPELLRLFAFTFTFTFGDRARMESGSCCSARSIWSL